MKTSSALLWVMICVVVLQVHCQHWSYGLSPGGRRAAESLTGTFQAAAYLPRKGPASYMCDYVDLSPRNKLSKLKELLDSLADAES
ncbi:progonadoliberin-1 [Pygocentrus nattereri]|uniref:progonadoliberin-1 n=1 Tax=Pygocentrus nattereri TaxID=42514 RepID=UPI000814A9ED|nr:progonadoliberin-1 [Pygocentrus nattereri]